MEKEQSIMDVSVIGVLEDQDILLDVAALALSQLDHEESDLDAYLKQLDEIEERICQEGRSAFLSSERAIVLAEVLHDELGFIGDAEAYDAPINADFMRVLDRKQGLPISLSILYVAMARRAGWTAHILNGPGHVLVQVGEKNPVIIDPFSGGRQVTKEHFEALYEAFADEAETEGKVRFVQMSNRQILARLLFNQAVRAEKDDDAERALTVYERITKITPETADVWHHLARLRLALGDTDGARASLLAMSEVTSDKQVRAQIMAAFRALDGTGPTLH
jgi:regulator of sirC expression with transglutaminase-like and TPR domain